MSIEDCKKLVHPHLDLATVAGLQRLLHATGQVIADENIAAAVQGRQHGRHLRQDVDAETGFRNHLLQPSYLPFDALEATVYLCLHVFVDHVDDLSGGTLTNPRMSTSRL